MPISGFRKRNSTCLYQYFSISGTFKISFLLTKVETSNLVVFVNAFLKMNTEIRISSIRNRLKNVHLNADNRTEPFDDIKGWFIDGLFCRHCNKWTLGPIAIRDTTSYKMIFPYNKIKNMADSSIKRGLMNRLEKVPDKKTEGDQMIMHTNSERVIEIVPYLKSLALTYEIEPPFPHKIE